MDANFFDTVSGNIILFIFQYLVCLFFIIQGIRGLKTGLDFVGEEMPPWVFKGSILIGFVLLIATGSSNSREIAVKMLENYVEPHQAIYISIIVSAFVTGVTAFCSYIYWKKLSPTKRSLNK